SGWPAGRVPLVDPREDRTLRSFFAAVPYPAGRAPWAVAVGDFDRDGRLDLVSSNFGDNTVSLLAGNGDGSLQAPRSFPAGPRPVAVVVEDFNGDGMPALAVADQGTPPDHRDGAVSVLLGNGDGSFQPARTYALGMRPEAMVAGDFNGDGVPDLVTAHFGGTLSVL